MMVSAIVAEELGKNFGKTAALADVSFAVPQGAIYALVGANGAGKTTLIKILMNIHRPTAGRALVLQKNSETLSGESYCAVGYVSENQEMADWTTVGGMLSYFRGFYPTWDCELEARLVRQFELPLKRKLKSLSRGMRMKAAFVSSLAYRPALLVLDEPLSGLDPFVRDELVESLKGLCGSGERGMTIVISSHDLGEIEDLATHVGFIEQGRMLFSEEMAVLKDRFREVRVSVTEPYAMEGAVPAGWMHIEASDGTVRFVHTDYHDKISEAEVRSAMPTATEVAFDGMPLRSIFLAIAKANRMRRDAARKDEVQR